MESNRQIYNNILQQLIRRGSCCVPTQNVRIVDTAGAQPVASLRKVYIGGGLGLMSGLLLGCGLAVMLYRRAKFHKPGSRSRC